MHPHFTMTFDPNTIDHLGLRLYSTLPPVVAEMVSNAYDAESPKVEIVIPEGTVSETSEVVVRDYGHGLTADEVQDEFLPIGRNRRGPTQDLVMSKNGKVRVTGRKGLGKLSGFGIARTLEVRAVKDGEATCLCLSYDEIKRWVDTHLPNEPYEPQYVEKRSGSTVDPNGVEIRLSGLHRQRAISLEHVRRGLAMRLAFIGKGFDAYLNGTKIEEAETVRKTSCEQAWDVGEIPDGGKLATGDRVTGWIGFLPGSSQSVRGVNIYASQKAVELDSFFNLPSTHAQFARAYLVGELQAQFLDEKEDLASTARDSVIWESVKGQALQEWGRRALTWAFDQWVEHRRKKKETEIVRVGGFDKWLGTRDKREQKVAQRMVALLVDEDRFELGAAGPVLDIIKSSVETVAFRDLVDEIEAEGGDPIQLLRLFSEWRVIEAREHLKLADGRQEAIDKLQQFIEHGALEVQQLQPLFNEHLWLLDPTWTEAAVQPTYTKMLREEFKETEKVPEIDRRLDLLGVKSSGLTIVELKRPEKTLSRDDLSQIEEYVDWARTQWGSTGPHVPRYVNGLLIVGQMSKNAELLKKVERLAADDIRVETFRDLHSRAVEYYAQAEKNLSKVAPEFVRAKKMKGAR